MNYIFVGKPAAGKSTARKFLVDRFDFQGFECSDYVHAACKEHKTTPGDLHRRFGKDFVAKQILEHIVETPFVVSGCRKPEEVKLLKAHYECKVIEVYASDKRCFNRHLDRKKDDIKTFEVFYHDKIMVNYSVGLNQVIMRHSDLMIDNDYDDKELFYEVLREIVEKDR